MRMRGLIASAVLVVTACSPGITSTAPSGDLASGPAGSAAPTLGASGSAAPLPSSSTPAGSGVPSPAATVVPTPAGPIAFDVIPPGSAIEVTVAELNLREEATTSAKRVELLKRGQVLIVSPYDGIWFGAGPVKKNGYTWYPVMKLQNGDADGDLKPLPQRPIFVGTEVQVGWVATDNGETNYVKALPPRCPTTVDLANVEAMLAAERLACFGGPIVLEGTFGCPGCGSAIPGNYDPIWLAYPQSLDFLSVHAAEQVGPLSLRFKPGGPARPEAGSIIRATVHVDDPAASSCEMALLGDNDTLVAVSAATAVLFCREQLVVDSYDVIGVDAGFPG